MIDKSAYMKEYRIKNKERIRESSRAYRLKNKLKLQEICREWKREHRDKNRAWAKAFYHSHKETYIQNAKKWIKSNPEKMRFIVKQGTIKRRTNERLPTKYIQAIYEENIKKYGTLTCELCRMPIEFGLDSIDHNMPISRGGGNEQENLQVLHRSCNAKKYTKTNMEYFNAKSA